MALTNVTKNSILDVLEVLDADVLDTPLHTIAVSPNGQKKTKPKILLINVLKISLDIYKLVLPGKTVSIDVISSSQLSAMKDFGERFGFQFFKIPSPSVIAAVVSSCTANDATI